MLARTIFVVPLVYMNDEWTAIFPCSDEPELFNDATPSISNWLCGITDKCGVLPIMPQRGISEEPMRRCMELMGCISVTLNLGWLTLEELNSFDYDAPPLSDTSEIPVTTREYLGPYYFQELRRINDLGVTRIAFGTYSN